MDYQKIAGDVLFGADVLDNTARGNFIEAVTFDALNRHDRLHNVSKRWHHTGLGWGPWDLQRGAASSNNRVRFQLKAKARKQLWPDRSRRLEYSLGYKNDEALPKYFATDFPTALIGTCELVGYRTDFFLLAWHEQGSQADPNTYAFHIVPTGEIPSATTGLLRTLPVEWLKDRPGTAFADLPWAMNAAADSFLEMSGKV